MSLGTEKYSASISSNFGSLAPIMDPAISRLPRSRVETGPWPLHELAFPGQPCACIVLHELRVLFDVKSASFLFRAS